MFAPGVLGGGGGWGGGGVCLHPRFAGRLFVKDDPVIRGGFRMGYDEIFNNRPANMAECAFNLTPPDHRTMRQQFPWAGRFTKRASG